MTSYLKFIKFFSVLLVILFYSCDKPSSNLPDNYVLTEIDKLINSNNKLIIYRVETQDTLSVDLLNINIKCKSSWISEDWRKLDTNKKEDKRIAAIIKEYPRLIDSDNVNELINSIESGSDIYIATCYVIMAPKTFHEYKFYKRLYIYDELNKKYYISKAQHDFIL